MKALIIFISAILFSSITANAQELDLGFNGRVVFPQENFDAFIHSPGGGLNIYALYSFDDSPFALGLDFSFNSFGTDSHEELPGTTGADRRLWVENKFQINQAMMLAKAKQQSGILQAYIEGLAGFNFFISETRVSDRRVSSDPVISQIDFNNIAFALGGGAGVKIRLFDNSDSESWRPSGGNTGASLINVGFRYLHGPVAEYMKGGAVTFENEDVILDSLRSGTDMLIIQLGFVFTFNR